MVAAETLQFVQNFKKHPQDEITPRATAVARLAVDIEKNDIGVGDDRPLDVRKEHGIFHLALKKLDRLLTVTVVGVRAVIEQIRQNLQEVRLTRTKKTRNPDTHL